MLLLVFCRGGVYCDCFERIYLESAHNMRCMHLRLNFNQYLSYHVCPETP